MYHCHTLFYLLMEHKTKTYEIIKKMPALKNFTHEFSGGTELEKARICKADVIIADISNMNGEETISTLIRYKQDDAELILLMSKEQLSGLNHYLPEITDIWTTPLSDSEIQFRFSKWQQRYKKDKDFWQTEQYFETLINHIPNLVWYKDKTGVHEKVNDSFCQTVNKTKEQIQGRRHAYIWNVEYDDPACIESEREVMEKKETCISQETIKTGEGTRLLTTYKSPLYDWDHSVMGTVGMAIDITKEQAYAHELMKKNQVLEMMYTTMNCGILCHSIDGSEILSINQAALDILGYESKEEMIAHGFDTVAASVLDEDKPKLRACIATLQKTGDNVNTHYRVQHKNGDILHVIGNIKLLEEDGNLFYQRYLLDFTSQKLQEEQNEKIQAELIHALSMDYSLVYFFDLHSGTGTPLRIHNNVMANVDFSKNDKIILQESMEQYIQNYVYEEDREMLWQATSQKTLIEELTKNNTYSINYRNLGKDGIQYYQLKAVRTGFNDGIPSIVVGFRSIEDEIHEELEKKKLLENALSQAKKASEAKSVFLSNMSHDIRTPMNAIVGFTTLAISHIDQKELVQEYLNKIQSSGNHLLNLINDVLDMSRIESGKMQLEEKVCRLPDILHDLCNILQAEIHAKKLKLHIEAINVRHEDVYCDRLRLNQILLNLLSNAVKYTNENGTIRIRLTEKNKAGNDSSDFEFRIIDSGIGMSNDFLHHIFEPFERERNSTISGIQGTGLGMAITKNIVDMMHGSIHVNSTQGVGSEFILNFTFRLNSDDKKYPAIPKYKNRKALVVTENPDTRTDIMDMLKRIEIHPESHLSGKETIQYIQNANNAADEYSLYIIDRHLTEIDGIALARKIREIVGKQPPIIMTAYDSGDVEKEALEAGVTFLCRKPLFFSEMYNCLNKENVNKKNSHRKIQASYTGHILLAEDVEINQEIAVTILNEAGFITEVAENGQIAVDMLKKSEPGYYQLILMDIQMPVMDGYEATAAIRNLKDKKLASIPILAMSANAFEEDKQEALKSGMNGHIAKPINIKKLFDTLDQILS